MKKEKGPYIDVGEISEERFGGVRANAKENGEIIKNVFLDVFDILVRESKVSGRTVVFANCDGLTSSRNITEAVIKPVFNFNKPLPDNNCADFLIENVLLTTEVKKEKSLDSAILDILRGNIIVFIDGETECVTVGVQSLPERSLEEPETEVQERGSREGFVENVKTNLTLVRKRLCTVNFKVKMLEIGKTGKTRVAVCYMEDKVKKETLNEVMRRLSNTEYDMIYDATYLRRTLDTKRKSMFSMVGTTERPDTFSAKLNEGKVGLLVDGTPLALVVPILFIENFQELDDYFNRPYFATFIRIIRITAFLISVFLPGIFVSICLFHQELLPNDILYSIVLMESNTLFDLTTEALIIHLIYEFVREAGIRMPKAVGHAVSIVGALVIGDAAVSAGLIGAPMLIVVALSSITSLVVSTLYQPTAVLRIGFIVVGGLTGLYGLMLGAAFLIMSLASMNDYGISFLSPLTPYDRSLWRDTFSRAGVTSLEKRIFNINKLN